ncbi:MAG: hypothetical protein ACRC4T_03475 [Cetobacterium sp.]
MGKQIETIPEKKKRLSFTKTEDLYYMIYNILLILDTYQCIDEKKVFKDYKKLSYILIFINSKKNIQLLKYLFYDKIENKKELKRLYFLGLENREYLKYVLLLLEKNQIVGLITNKNTIDIYLMKNDKIKRFLDEEVFVQDKKNILELKNFIKMIRTVKYESFIKKIFKENGVEIWEK